MMKRFSLHRRTTAFSVVITLALFLTVWSFTSVQGVSIDDNVDTKEAHMIFNEAGDMTNASKADDDGILRLENAGAARISINPATNVASFVRFDHGQALRLADSASADIQAQAFLTQYGSAFGIMDLSQLVQTRIDVDYAGNTHITYQQMYEGVPVFAGVFRVHLNVDNAVYAANGVFLPKLSLKTVAGLSTEQASEIAINEVLTQQLMRATLEASSDISAIESSLYIYREGLVQGELGNSTLVYEIEVGNGYNVREFVYVDAHTGRIVDQFSGIHGGLDRKVYETSITNPPVWEDSAGDPYPIPAGWEGGTAQQVTDWQNEIDAAGETYNLFASMAGYISYDNADATMQTVNNDPGIFCPNANWNGTSTNYCSNVTGDDTVAHEWAHAYTEYTNNLIYAWQPGALNESYSDIWGEVVDMLNGRGLNDATIDTLRTDDTCSLPNGANFPGGATESSVRWLSGEDDPAFAGIPAGSGNAIRDLWNPACFGDPGRVTDPNYWCTTGDGGGVHTNSGVPNHAFALMVDGGTYNGVTVAGIGLTKAAHIHWAAQNMLTPSSNFMDHADALSASCSALTGVDLSSLSVISSTTGISSGEMITTTDCVEVSNAIAAVEFYTDPAAQCGFEPMFDTPAPNLCTGQGDEIVVPIVSEDWESGMGSWIAGTRDVANAATFDTPDWAVVGSLPDGRLGQAMFVEDNPAYGNCVDDTEAGVLYLESPDILLPAGIEVPRVTIDHWVATEAGWDGGNIKISVNGGAWMLVPAVSFEFNAYNGSLNPAPPNDNPMGGEVAFTGTDGGSVDGSWGQSQINLDGLATGGDTIRLRAEMGLDGCNGVVGWYVDDVQVYACQNEATSVVCGDSILDFGETCDDGNTTDGDGCSMTCQVESGWTCTDPIPGGPVNAINDGGFELGDGGGAWTEFSSTFGTPICSAGGCGTGGGTGPNTGAFWTWFGGVSALEEGAVSQSVVIPTGATELSFWLEIPACDDPVDYMELLIDGTQEFMATGGDSVCDSIGYVEHVIDISAYADDAAHIIEFHSEVFGSSGGVSNFFLDDVLIDIGVAPPTPSSCRPVINEVVCNGGPVDFIEGLPTSFTTDDGGGPVYWTTTDDPVGCDQGNQTLGSDAAACADSDALNGAGSDYDAQMWTNPIDLSGAGTAMLSFTAAYNDIDSGDFFDVDVSIDGGTTWTNHISWDSDHWGPGEMVMLDLSTYAGESAVIVRYRYYGDSWDWWAQVDDISLTCVGPPIIEVNPDMIVHSQAPDDVQVRSLLTIGNVGEQDLVWMLDEADSTSTCDAPSDISWLIVSPVNGTTVPSGSITLDLVFNSVGLASGTTYTGTLCINSNDIVNPRVEVPVTLIIDSVTDVSLSSFGSSQQPFMIVIWMLLFGGMVATLTLVWRRRRLTN